MPQLIMNRAAVIDGNRYEAGDVVSYSGEETTYFVSIGICSIAPDPATPKPAKPAGRTKAQIEADLAAAKAAEAQLQADLSQATQ